MKYSKVYPHADTKYYVMKSSSSIFTDEAYDTEEEALKACVTKSIKWHLEQADKLLNDNKANYYDIDKNESQYEQIQQGVQSLKISVQDIHKKHNGYDENDPCTWYS